MRWVWMVLHVSDMLAIVCPFEAQRLQMKRLFGLQSVLHELDPSHMCSPSEGTVCAGFLSFPLGSFHL